MSEVFLAAQIASLAVKIEEQGVIFYNALVRSTDDKPARELFTLLSKQENRHASFFKALIKSERENPNLAVYSGEFYYYVLAILTSLKNFLFDDNGSIILPLDFSRALDTGIDIEKKSIEAYTNIYNTLDKRYTNVLLDIIDEEKRHLKSLLALRKKNFPEDEKK
ncbi:MAG: ferritin family protein [Candidatus Omnitrophica bacterium]|nr:ferritin family protein [Candidatus Omnitrophota bacterium]